MKREDFSEAEVHRQFDDALRRAKTWQGTRVGLGTIARYARARGYRPPVDRGDNQQGHSFDLDAATPIYSPSGMPPRDFAGPSVGDALLFPMKALSLFVALGGAGKTTALVKMCVHIAAGRAWGCDEIARRKVLIFSIEESQSELNRKYGAAVHAWTDAERIDAEENLRLISCLDRDVRLTKVIGRQVDGSDVSDAIIRAALEFGAEVIVLDHLQGFASGDLNNSDTATALARESNKIVAQTGAAVVQAAHIAKANINAQSVFDGFTTGTLAFENAARQVTGVIPLPEDDAKGLGLDPHDYMRIEMPKNSYGPSREKAYLRKVYVQDFHTITVEPYTPLGPAPVRSAIDRVRDAVRDYLKAHPGTTPNKLDLLAGTNGVFKASKQDVRTAAKALVDDGELLLKPLTKTEREALGLPHQAQQVYEHVE